MSNKYKNEFQEIRALGRGSFSTVFEAVFSRDNKPYAIKKIPITFEEKEKALKEIEILRSLKSDYIVYYIDSWIENNYYLPYKSEYNLDHQSLLFNPKKTFLLHIQMELCSMSLDGLIKSLGFIEKNSMNSNDYSTVCDLFVQILECVDYLHKHDPPIIHMDLKPENIMLVTVNNSYKVKLTDFGLSTYHKYVDQSHTKYIGTLGYRAPEVDTKEYDTKADIYSLGMIMELLFNINHNSEKNNTFVEIKANYENVKQLCLKCVSHIITHRPDCDQMLNEKHLWFYKIFNENLALNLYIKKWPQINKIKKELKKCNKIAIMKSLETKVIFTGKDKNIYALRLSDSTIQQPVIINELKNKEIQSIVCGDYHILCLTKDMLVYSFGDNEFGQLCDGTFISNNKPTIIQELSDKKIHAIMCGANFSIALSMSGNAFVWGSNCYGQLCNRNDISYANPNEIKLPNSENFITASTGSNHCLALSDCGKLYGWGNNECGQLGIGCNVNQFEPIQVLLDHNIIVKKIRCGMSYSIILTSDNNIYWFGQLDNEYSRSKNQPNKLETTIKFIDIETLYSTNLLVALSTDNRYYIWGENFVTPTITDLYSFNEAYLYFNVKFNEISSNRNLLNKFNENNTYKLLNEKIISNVSSFKLIRIKESKALIQKTDDSIYMFRLNKSIDKSEEGIVNELSKKKINSIICGLHHVLCLTETMEVYSYGDNNFGQLGNGSRNDKLKPMIIKSLTGKHIVSISCGSNHCLALSEFGELYVWGSGYFGQTGNGYNFVLNPIKINAFNSIKLIAISCGFNYCLALSSSGILYGWGDNEFGQLGLENERNENSSRNKPVIISNKDINIKKISCGRFHSLILDNDHNIYSFGRNNCGQLGIDNTINQFKMIKIKTKIKFVDIYTNWCDNISAALSQNGKYYVWGDCGEYIITTPSGTEFKSFDKICVKYSKCTFTTNQLNLRTK